MEPESHRLRWQMISVTFFLVHTVVSYHPIVILAKISHRYGVVLLLFQGPVLRQPLDVAGVAPVVHLRPQEGGGEVVHADQDALDPREEEHHDLPLALVAHHLRHRTSAQFHTR